MHLHRWLHVSLRWLGWAWLAYSVAVLALFAWGEVSRRAG